MVCFCPFGIIGPYFFEENGFTLTVNSARYIEMITNFLWPELRRRRINCANMWFQQDGATALTANESVTIVRNMFLGYLISRFGDVLWPPHSPDLSTCDFFLWGYWNCVFTLTNPVRWMIWRKPSVRKFVRSIVSCWPMSWTILEKGLKTASKNIFKTEPSSMACFKLSFCINKCEFTWKTTEYCLF